MLGKVGKKMRREYLCRGNHCIEILELHKGKTLGNHQKNVNAVNRSECRNLEYFHMVSSAIPRSPLGIANGSRTYNPFIPNESIGRFLGSKRTFSRECAPDHKILFAGQIFFQIFLGQFVPNSFRSVTYFARFAVYASRMILEAYPLTGGFKTSSRCLIVPPLRIPDPRSITLVGYAFLSFEIKGV